jgi:uncharacterized SAM-binding protein YcdF (DUF218 family)
VHDFFSDFLPKIGNYRGQSRAKALRVIVFASFSISFPLGHLFIVFCLSNSCQLIRTLTGQHLHALSTLAQLYQPHTYPTAQQNGLFWLQL